MNREEIEDWREWLVADVRLENRAGANELCDLAARALELEKVLHRDTMDASCCPTPDLDPEEVRRACEWEAGATKLANTLGYPEKHPGQITVFRSTLSLLAAAAREYLRMVEGQK